MILGFELRFLGFCVRSGLISIDPFGLFYFSGVKVEGNEFVAKVIKKIQEKTAQLVKSSDCEKLAIMQETGWSDWADITKDFTYGAGPEIRFKPDLIDPVTEEKVLGIDSPLGTDVEANLLAYKLPWDVALEYWITPPNNRMVDVVADTVIHEMSHWKARTTNHGGTDKQGWNFMKEIFQGQWTIIGGKPGWAVDTNPK